MPNEESLKNSATPDTDNPSPQTNPPPMGADVAPINETNSSLPTLDMDSTLITAIEKDLPDIDISLTEIIVQLSREPIPGPSTSNDDAILNIENIRPLPKALPRSTVTNRKRTRKSAILTDTPEKIALENEQILKMSKKKETAKKKSNNMAKKGKGEGKKKQKDTRDPLSSVKKKI